VVIGKFVISRTVFQVSRQGAHAAVMLVHHKARTTQSGGPEGLPEGSLFPSFGVRQRRLTMRRHRPRGASCPENGKSDPGFDEFTDHHTRRRRQ
jgi:hypothetical protein